MNLNKEVSKTSLMNRLSHAWNAFRGVSNEIVRYETLGIGSGANPTQPLLNYGNERSVLASIYNRIAIDVQSADIRHVRLNQNGSYDSEIDDGLNYCLKTAANIDQTPRAFIGDVVLSMFDEGAIGIVPVDCTLDPKDSTSYDINSMRVGRIVEWYPRHVRMMVYNDSVGEQQEIVLPKAQVAIVENPFYTVVNEQNAMIRRLVRKLTLLDKVDEDSVSGKLDLLIQLPYTVKSQINQERAESRRSSIESQLANSRYGIAYIDATERVTQLNRPVENNFLSQIEYLTKQIYTNLGMSEDLLNGSAGEQEIANYQSRIVTPILDVIVESMDRTFITKTARTQGQAIMYFVSPFRNATPNQIAELSDKLTRNAILSSNEFRSILGYKPSKDPKADELSNKNLNQNTDQENPTV